MAMVFQPDEEGLGAILESIPEFVLVVGPDRRILYINRLEPGFDLEDVLGMKATEFMFPESQEAFDAALDSVLQTGSREEYEFKVSLSDGSPAWYRSRMIPFGNAGEVTAVVLVATNITELKEKQEEVDRLRRLLPICSWCDRIRSEDGTWERMESYLEKERDTRVTHGMCPDCERKVDGSYDDGESDGSVA